LSTRKDRKCPRRTFHAAAEWADGVLLADAAGNIVFYKNNDLADVLTEGSRRRHPGPVAVGYVGSDARLLDMRRKNSLCRGRADAIVTLMLRTAQLLRGQREGAEPFKDHVPASRRSRWA
jgi:hypothetical protein